MARAASRMPLFKAGLRFALATALLLVLSHLSGARMIESMLPLLKAEIAWLDDTYRVVDLRLSEQGSDSVVALDVGLARIVVVGGRVLYPDPRAQARVTTLSGHVLTPVMLCLALIAAWPARRVVEYPLRMAIAIPVILVVLLLDVPFVLWAETWDIHVSALEPGRFSPLLMWKDFLQGGGRLVLGLGAGVIAAVMGNVLSHHPRRN